MSNMFKKALGLFVEFEPEETKPAPSSWGDDGLPLQVKHTTKITATATAFINQNDLDKFEKHFEELFDKVNLPGPDYYEFWKMMEALEAAVPDETVRMNAVFSTLKIQGLSKEMLIDSAEKYLQVVDKDKQEFQNAVNTKVLGEIEGRKASMAELEKRNNTNNEMIQKLTKEINENQQKITSLKKEVIDEEAKINSNKNGYNIACDAMLAKLSGDIQKIKTSL
ncbi:MAG: hypothetical protein H7Z13_10055 [Ferruginibacter sp.]|nr:hypothetical protein [Ferruginibacter sp.]